MSPCPHLRHLREGHHHRDRPGHHLLRHRKVHCRSRSRSTHRRRVIPRHSRSHTEALPGRRIRRCRRIPARVRKHPEEGRRCRWYSGQREPPLQRRYRTPCRCPHRRRFRRCPYRQSIHRCRPGHKECRFRRRPGGRRCPRRQ